VLPDDARGQRELVSRLIAAGHRRIAYLTLPTHMVATTLRSQGYRQALAEAGIAYDPALVDCADYEGRDDETQILWDTIDRMLRLPDPPSVLCCGNDKMAVRVYGILRSRGIKVPDEISVAGYDNYRVIAETLFPPLTTVELSYTAIGLRTAQRLLAMISEPAALQAREDRDPTLVAGPVYWRGSVTERRPASISNLKLVRED
jgi:LacI family transcriptional regulator